MGGVGERDLSGAYWFSSTCRQRTADKQMGQLGCVVFVGDWSEV